MFNPLVSIPNLSFKPLVPSFKIDYPKANYYSLVATCPLVFIHAIAIGFASLCVVVEIPRFTPLYNRRCALKPAAKLQ
jgi:hypothetical protein